ncbi:MULTISPECIES: hypothetical protein [unclassified Moorena]|uniref:hypothetical protein n=1 Tax=unclassified Moorena TaxID=2683338 RepID=UPI0013B6568D|nr:MULTISPECIES: hypothetical protein [unclassified Moorena]NEP34010.1 hypothetical protein [Moorena sp. SIO3B2]NEQ05085.1 hypothetical protein [Moorena sp. SIO4E2]
MTYEVSNDCFIFHSCFSSYSQPNPKVKQPLTFNLQPFNPSTLQPFNPSTLQPFNPSTLQPF